MSRFLLAAALSCAASLACAQSVAAHINTGIVLESLPGTAEADSLLRQYQDSLGMGFSLMEQEFTAKLETYRNPELAQNRTPKQTAALEQELQELQQQVQVYQQESARMFEQRRGKYLNPLVTRVSEAIAAYAKTNNINIVYDVSVGGVLVFADENRDITDEVIATLQP